MHGGPSKAAWNGDFYGAGDTVELGTLALGGGVGKVATSTVGRSLGRFARNVAPRGVPNITYLTRAGNCPSWSTVKARYWKIMNNGHIPSGNARVRMRSTGEIKTIKVSKELHHIDGRNGANPHRFNNLQELWPRYRANPFAW